MKELIYVPIRLGDAADIHYMIEKEIASVELELEHALGRVSEERNQMLKNRIISFKGLQRKFDL